MSLVWLGFEPNGGDGGGGQLRRMVVVCGARRRHNNCALNARGEIQDYGGGGIFGLILSRRMDINGWDVIRVYIYDGVCVFDVFVV